MVRVEVEWKSTSDRYRKKFNAARKLSVQDMHLEWYTGNVVELYLYSKHFWYLEISRATIALGAYLGDELVGVLLADMDGEPKVFANRFYRLFVRIAEFVIKLGYKDASTSYEKANKDMLAAYKEIHYPEGELNFFAVNPDIKGKGIGTKLLNELERQEVGKEMYLYTDSGSTYQFYEHRGFKKVGKRDIELDICGEMVPLTCMLFAKKLKIR